jgi:phosphatidylserine/phosphatidylglycerophosphate/cardiolipin synthase-like enzyme
MQYYCSVCKESITDKECSYAMAHYNMPLCRKHQEIQKIAKARLAESEQKPAPVRDPEVKPVSVVVPKSATTVTPQAIPIVVSKPQEVLTQNLQSKSQDALIQWLIQWTTEKHIDIAVESRHFFLEGMRLEELARDLIEKAQFDIFVTSPFVDSCYLVTAIQEAKVRRVTVKLVARRPENVKEDRQKIDCQANLKRAGIVIHYINQIHAKIIVVDSKIAIISSMNLYSGSTGGALFEAGVVSFEKKVVDSATKYISGLLERPESTDTDASSRYYKRRF